MLLNCMPGQLAVLLDILAFMPVSDHLVITSSIHVLWDFSAITL